MRITLRPGWPPTHRARARGIGLRRGGAAAGREVAVFTTCHVVCRADQTEAEDYYEHYAVAMEDRAAVDHYMANKERFTNPHDPAAYRLHRKRFVGGAGTYPLIGTPERIAAELIAIAEAGFAGVGLSFVNYAAELPFFAARVLPLLSRAGLRGSL